MDGLIYTAMTGASHILDMQATASNNLANVATTGFRAQIDEFRAVPVLGQTLPTRAFVTDSSVGNNFAPGAIEQTGNSLDVVVQGQGWIAVDMGDGTEAYTRNGGLQISPNGVLQTWDGHPVQGTNGPITIPPGEGVTIGSDGTVSGTPSSGIMPLVDVLGQIKLVNPPTNTMVRGDDGYFRLASGKPAETDSSVTVISGAIEGSNVNPVSEMVNMISLGRQFEMQMKLLSTADSNESQASQILTIT